MISAADYNQLVVHPSLDEFYANNGDLRLAMHAATSLTHAVDYVFQNRGPDPKTANTAIEIYRRDLATRCLSFRVVEGFAMASKHCTMNRKDLKGFSSSQQARFYPSILGVMRLGQTFLGDTVGGICIRWTDHGWVNLTEALQEACAELEAEFPELRGVFELPTTKPPAGAENR